MTEIRIGYARCSTDRQDLTAQQEALEKLGVSPDRIYIDKGLIQTGRGPAWIKPWPLFAVETH